MAEQGLMMSYRELFKGILLEAEYREVYGPLIYHGGSDDTLREIHYDNLAIDSAIRRLVIFTSKGEREWPEER